MTGAAAPELVPDPLLFSADALAARGALCEPTGEAAALAVLPPALATELALPEECMLARERDVPGTVCCALGSPLVERLVSDARRVVPVARAQLARERPRSAHAAALAARFVVRNGVVDVLDTVGADTWYALLVVGWVAEADDRHEGLVHAWAAAGDGAAPDPALQALLDPRTPSMDLVEGAERPAPAAGLPTWLEARATRAVRDALPGLEALLARRHARDHGRIADYFRSLIAEARTPRRKVAPAAIAEKVRHLEAEREAKLRDLASRFALRVTMSPVALWWVRVPAVGVNVRIRRRKEERTLLLRLPAGSPALDRVRCDGCAGWSAQPAVCDERLHLLCERCAPGAQGRLRCGACS